MRDIYVRILAAAWVLLLVVVTVVAARHIGDAAGAALAKVATIDGEKLNLIATRLLLIIAGDACALLTMRWRREG